MAAGFNQNSGIGFFSGGGGGGGGGGTGTFTELTPSVSNGGVIVGQFTYQHNDLIGATALNFIIVSNVIESIGNGDFTFDSASGTITRVNSWQLGDYAIIPFNKTT